MPSSIVFQGGRKYRPGVYGEIKQAPTTNPSIASGAVALVGDFPLFQKDSVHTYDNLEAFLEATGGEYGLDILGQIGFSPRADLGGNPTSITIVNARNTTQASKTINGLKIKAKHYGVCGNRVFVALDENGSDADLYDLFVYESGNLVEKSIGIGKGKIASLQYTGTLLSDVKLLINQATDKLALNFIKNVASSIIIPGTAIDFSDLIVNGALTFTQRTSSTPSAVAITIHGLSEAGSTITTTTTLPAGAVGTTITTGQLYSQITSIVLDGANDYAGSIEISGSLYSAKLSDISNIGSTLTTINQSNSDIVVVLPESIVSGEQLDNVASLSIVSSPLSLTCDCSFLKDFLDGSLVVEGEIVSGDRPVGSTVGFNLIGGSIGALTSSDWQSALDALVYKQINIVVAYTDDIAIHQLVKDHCVKASVEAGLERNAWVGTSAGLTLNQIYSSYVKVLNDRNVAVVGQSPIVIVGGEKKTLEPKALAFFMACLQASLGVATPLTRKQPKIFGTTQAFNPEADASLAIQKGIVILNGQDRGLKVERSITTWLKDNNAFYTEVSANESINLSIRDLRLFLDSEIGSKSTVAQKDNVQRLTINRLSFQRDSGLILDFKDVVVRQVGDTISVVYAMAGIEPLNFITITANVGRI